MNYQIKLVEAYPEVDWDKINPLAKRATGKDITIYCDWLIESSASMGTGSGFQDNHN